MAKKIKKVDPKAVAKKEVISIVREALEAQGFTINDGVDYGMTASTVVVGHSTCDVQLKLITPKAGVFHYEKLEDEEDEDLVAEDLVAEEVVAE